MNFYEHCDVKIYNLTNEQKNPEWVKLKKSKVSTNQGSLGKIQLIQDFEMPALSNSIKMSNDQQYICVTGLYKPRIRCFDLNNLSMKFERCMDSEALNFILLEKDFSKIVFLQADRFVEFHSIHGSYYRSRIPFYGRDLIFNSITSDLLFVGNSSEISRLNLDLGRFMKPIGSSLNQSYCCAFNEITELFLNGGDKGMVECWDFRTKSRVTLLNTENNCPLPKPRDSFVNCLKFFNSTTLAVGTGCGKVLIYDMRFHKPFIIKDHLSDLPIKKILNHFNDERNFILSMDRRFLKIWDLTSEKTLATIEPGTDLNDLCQSPDSGLIFLTHEAQKILTYFIPILGQPPNWCSMLSHITEELEEDPYSQIYEDYIFLTRKELNSIGLTHLIGTNLLRAEMHGFYMKTELYKNVSKNLIKENSKDSVETFSRFKEKQSEINSMKNSQLCFEKFSDLKKNQKQKERFFKLFNDKNFEVDAESEHYKRTLPSFSNQIRNVPLSSINPKNFDIRQIKNKKSKKKRNR